MFSAYKENSLKDKLAWIPCPVLVNLGPKLKNLILFYYPRQAGTNEQKTILSYFSFQEGKKIETFSAVYR
jgi:hypothetical protein